MIQSIEIYYKQGFREVLTKTKQDCSFDGKTVTLRLSQEDTLGFKEGELRGIRIGNRNRGRATTLAQTQAKRR